ncbi:Glycosyltransferase involved in cell wall bisynthesis [Flavobacterium micromati]|uniref:Glycosyltransferase involved in cell wall bisynthesis n=1 Tax=Flavobacterium micromati TaxID=229205 RepID=A0A1M5H698_9FLAO|nr:glycosyltransferase family 2 protein [Flavobacterium micromati]SHG11541.1 Glycosyltransferase involved in cell wall bisynthesis [Flavobacterium micromati]
MDSLISIIIPTYNRAHFLKEALDSVMKQTYSNWECIIVDDGSNEENINNILKFISYESRIKFFKRPLNSKKGPSTCRNFGLKNAVGKYVQFFDDDDKMYRNLLKDKVDLIDDKKYDVVVSPLDFFSIEKKIITNVNKVFSNNIIESYVLGDISWYVSGPLWLKSFVLEYFDESVQTLDDWDFNLRNIYNNPNIGFLEKSLLLYNIYGIGDSLGTLAQLGDESQLNSVFYVYKKHFLLLKKMKILNHKMYFRFYILLVPVLRECLLNKYKISSEIFHFLKININRDLFLKFIKVFFGYYTYKFFNKGYSLVKFKV